jgi:O-methyltransferase involved in polyketide biosynthesis
MKNGEPSFTALAAAAARAAHLIVDDEPHIFRDTLAERLLGDRADELIAYHRNRGDHVVLVGARIGTTSRSRFTEDRLHASGLRCYVILGAGLDTYAYRAPDTGIRVFEVDHPATQNWKRERLATAGIAVPDNVVYIPLDFERGTLDLAFVREAAEGGKAGDGGKAGEGGKAGDNGKVGDGGGKAFVSWLGVTMYLTREAIEATLSELGRLPAGSEIVLDHIVPDEWRNADGRLYGELAAPVSAERGEPWLSEVSPPEMAELLDRFGFETIGHVRQLDAVDWPRTDALRPTELTVVTHARRRAT